MIKKSTMEFLKALGAHNSREWFHGNRELYDEARRNVLDMTNFLISKIEEFDDSVKGIEPEECLFRIHRDTRFSKDKTPYKTHFGAFIKQGGKNTPGAGYYLHISPNDSLLAGGIYMPPAPVLLAVRNAIAKDPKPLKKIIARTEFVREFGSLAGESLKTAPKGFPKDHPEIELLRLKHYMVVKDLTQKQVLAGTFPETCITAFRAMLHLNRYLNSLI